MLFNKFGRLGVLGLWAVSSLPTAFAAMSWDICTTDSTGGKTCTRRIPRSARLAVAVCCFLVLLMLVAVVIYIFIKRRRSDDEEYNVEAAQMEGPPTIIATEYNPTSGPSGVYSAGPNGHGTGKDKFPEREMTGPTQPLPAYQSDRLPTYTAPVSQTTFSDRPYPFAYNSRNVSEPPKTAFVTNGFPRPLLAGNRLKDRLKERPVSISGLNVPVPPPTH